MRTTNDLLAICAVAVGVATPGTAYAHDERGQCMAFTGTREAMLGLFRAHRAFLRGGAPVAAVMSADWADVHAIDRSECPNHMMPAITGEINPYTPY
ncbi:MAG: hypothetical protein ABR584_08065 [Candidatus Baltobacteraceae bacterium]